jgi:hypothetical protein
LLHLAARACGSLADRVGDTSRLSNAYSHLSIIVADHHDHPESKPSSTLYHLGYASDIHYALV